MVQIQGLSQQLPRADQRRPTWVQTGYNDIDLSLLRVGSIGEWRLDLIYDGMLWG
jgi:hypothetical protein